MGNLFSWMLGLFFKQNEQWLKEAELCMLKKFTRTSCMSQFIPISSNIKIRTLKFDIGFSKNTPALVLLHGLGAGLGVWAPCFDTLAHKFSVFALDIPGFGRSSRTPFFGNRKDVEYQFSSYLEEWRDAVGLENFVLLGHGFGGYIATIYAIRHPERVKHLILVEPWGYSSLPLAIVEKRIHCLSDCHTDTDGNEPYIEYVPKWMRMLNYILNFVDPSLFLLRNLPKRLGQWLWKFSVSQPKSLKVKLNALHASSNETDLTQKHSKTSLNESNQYLYYCNVLQPTGVTAFKKLNLFYFWPVSPLTLRMEDLDPEVPMTFIYGSLSCVDHKTGYEVYHLRPTSYVEVYMVQDAGHNIFIDNPDKFCDVILGIMEQETEKAERITSMNSSIASIIDEFYWDCSWETLNLSRPNLAFPEQFSDIPAGNWRDSLLEPYENNLIKPSKDFYCKKYASPVSLDDSGYTYKVERFETSDHFENEDEVLYPFSFL